MKVLHVLASNSYSGAENVVIQIIKNLRNNHDIDFAYTSPDGKIENTLNNENIKFYPLDGLNKKNLRKVVKEFKPDIIHAHDVKASLLSSFMKVPCISHLHNNDPKMGKISLKSLLYSLRMNKFSQILSVSDSVWSEFYFKKRCKNRFLNVMNPININEIKQKSLEYECDESFDIGFVGRLTHQKNPLNFIEIVSKISKRKPNIKVAIVGDGELKDEILHAIKENKLDSNIKMYGFVDNPYPIIKKFKLLCMTSSWEGFGLVAVEAMSLSIPVVCYNVGGLSNIVNEKSGLLCENEEEMINGLLELLYDNEYYYNKQKGVLLRVNELNNTDFYFDKVVSIYKKTVSKGF